MSWFQEYCRQYSLCGQNELYVRFNEDVYWCWFDGKLIGQKPLMKNGWFRANISAAILNANDLYWYVNRIPLHRISENTLILQRILTLVKSLFIALSFVVVSSGFVFVISFSSLAPKLIDSCHKQTHIHVIDTATIHKFKRIKV